MGCLRTRRLLVSLYDGCHHFVTGETNANAETFFDDGADYEINFRLESDQQRVREYVRSVEKQRYKVRAYMVSSATGESLLQIEKPYRVLENARRSADMQCNHLPMKDWIVRVFDYEREIWNSIKGDL